MTNNYFYHHVLFTKNYKYIIHNYYDNTYDSIGYYHFNKKADLIKFLDDENNELTDLFDVYVIEKGELKEYELKRYQNKSLENKIHKLINKDYDFYRINIYMNDLVDQLEQIIHSEHLYTNRVQFYKNIRAIHDQLYLNYIK